MGVIETSPPPHLQARDCRVADARTTTTRTTAVVIVTERPRAGVYPPLRPPHDEVTAFGASETTCPFFLGLSPSLGSGQDRAIRRLGGVGVDAHCVKASARLLAVARTWVVAH